MPEVSVGPPLRVALILTNLAGGGAEKAMLKMAALLAARDHEVEVGLLEDRRDHDVPEAWRSGRWPHPAACRMAGWAGASPPGDCADCSMAAAATT